MGLMGKLKEKKALKMKMIEAQSLEELKQMQFRHNETLYNSFLNKSEEFMRFTNMKVGQCRSYNVGDKRLTDYVTKLGLFKTSRTPASNYNYTYTYEGLIEDDEAKNGFNYVKISKLHAENNITVGYCIYNCVVGNPYDGFKNVDLEGPEHSVDMDEVGFVDYLTGQIYDQLRDFKEIDSEIEAE